MGTVRLPGTTQVLRALRRQRSCTWQSFLSVTAADCTPSGATLVQGSLDRGALCFIRSSWSPVSDGETPETVLASLGWRHKISLSRVTVAVPRRLLATRYFTLPSHDDAELHAMLGHQLALDLPVDLDQVCWTSDVVDRREDGTSLLLIHLIRREQLEMYLRPLRESGMEIQAVIPEGQVLAHLVGGVLGKGSDEQAAAVERAGVLHFVVERDGVLVYHHVVAALHGENGKPSAPEDTMTWVADEIEAVRSEFESCIQKPFPEALHGLQILEEGAGCNILQLLPGDMAQKTGLGLLLPPLEGTEASCGDDSSGRSAAQGTGEGQRELLRSGVSDAPIFARALAEVVACSPRDSGGLHDEARQRARRDRNGTLVRTGLYAGLALLVAVGLAASDLFVMHHKLQTLERRVAVAFPDGIPAELLGEQESNLGARSDAGFDPLKALASIQAAAPQALKLEEFTHTQGRAVSFQGQAADLAMALSFWERLSKDPLWADVRMLGLYRMGSQSDAPFHFEIEGRLATWHGGRPQ